MPGSKAGSRGNFPGLTKAIWISSRCRGGWTRPWRAGRLSHRPWSRCAAAAACPHRQGAIGAGLPGSAGDDGAGLVWNLLAAAQRSAPEVIALARLLAWSPPEPADAPRLIAASGLDASSGATSPLEALRFVTPSGPATVGGSRAIQMHRLFAEAVRTSTWSHDPAAAAWAMDRLLT